MNSLEALVAEADDNARSTQKNTLKLPGGVNMKLVAGIGLAIVVIWLVARRRK